MVSTKLHVTVLANIIGVSPKELRQVIREDVQPSHEFLEKFSKATYLPIQYLTGQYNSFTWPNGKIYIEYNISITNIKENYPIEKISKNLYTPIIKKNKAIPSDHIIKTIWDRSYFNKIKNAWYAKK